MKTHENFRGGDSSVALGGSRVQSQEWPAAPRTDERPRDAESSVGFEDRLHAIRSSLAGLAGALHVLTDSTSDLPEASRHRVESLLVAEIERLQRLVATEPHFGRPRELESLDLDQIIAHVVLSRRMAGQEVAWSPTGSRAWGRRDELVEVLNILLVNASRHGGGAPARIDVAETPGGVQVSVSDDGSGVPAELREVIFERGVRRPSSPGQGLGLAMARELVADLGGALDLRAGATDGACFDVLLANPALHGAA
jgi:two-component system OmpR family sensor kinase